MTMQIILTLLLPAAVMLGLYALLLLARNSRRELAALGKEILHSPDFDERHKQLVSDMLRDALDWRFMMNVTLEYPFVLFRRVRKALAGKREKRPEWFNKFMQDERAIRFVKLHMASVQHANPLFTVVFYIELAITFAVLTLVLWTLRLSLLVIDLLTLKPHVATRSAVRAVYSRGASVADGALAHYARR